MVAPEPSWRVKTRPCPFYQQGRCMFSESCNFLHTVSAHVNRELKTRDETATSSTPPNPPRVVIESPQSSLSSPRSPRTTSLLLALGDVVADTVESNPYGSISSPPNAGQDTWSESLPTLVNELGFGHFSQPDEVSTEHPFVSYEGDDVESDANWTAISDYEDDTISQPVQEFFAESTDDAVENIDNSGADEQPAAVDWTTPPQHDVVEFSYRNSISSTTSGLLSPIELSTLNFGPFRHSHSSRDSTSFDSGYAETWKPPIPLLSSPPRSPSVSSTFDLLSSPFGAPSARISSPRLGVFMPRSPASPARTISPYVVEDNGSLDLGIDSPGNRQDDTTYLTPPDSPSDPSRKQDADYFGSSEGHQDSVDAQAEDEIDSYGHTSIWDLEGAATAVFMGNVSEEAVQQDVNDAIIHSSKTPTHFLTSTLDFITEEAVGHSSTASHIVDDPSLSNSFDTDDDVDDNEDASKPAGSPSASLDDDTAFLAYLRSPMAMESTENDTLDSLYGAYSAVSFDRNSNSHSTINANLSQGQPDLSAVSNTSTPSSSLRERVFTPPPPVRKRSGTITADSPNSSSSPITSLDSISMGRSSPFSDIPTKQSTRSESPYGQDVDLSRKIPFGFRNSFTLGRAAKSTLITSRNGGRSLTSSPLQTHPEIPGSEPDDPDSNPPRSASSSVPKGLKPLRLSTLFDAKYNSRLKNHSRILSSSVKSVNSSRLSGNINRTSISSASVSSINSLSHNRLPSSTRSPSPSSGPYVRNSLLPLERSQSSPASKFFNGLAHLDAPPQSAPVAAWRRSINYSRPSSRLSEPCYEREEEDDFDDDTGHFSRDPYDETIRRSLPPPPHTAPNPRASMLQPPVYHIDTPKPTLMFAIASDNVDQVRQVLASGDAGPNECVGPQSALEFTLTNDKLSNKLEIVKALLAYGADPTVAKNIEFPSSHQQESEDTQDQPRTLLMDEMDAATKYYLDRADAVHTRRMSVLIHRSFFRPLTRVRYDLIGQDRALEQLFRVLSMHSRELAVSPMVVMLCGPSGHGKSLLARKFGSLLEVPTHTVNMTTLRSTHDLWESHSMSPYETPTTCTLAEFLTNNEGKRCVVVLDEIEKTEDPKTLYSLLMPWELGRCAFEAGKRHIDVKNVIWLGTSNIGHDLVFQHRDTRKNAEELMTREEYVELMALLRPKVSERLGTSILSRITTVLPFVPFTLEEKRAICSETLYTLGGELARSLPPEGVEKVIDTALAHYCAEEGARSLHRAISNQLVDII
ncbi:hypothetical protein BDN70DRAFT_872152 [Pholiota conissans]|uniref:C3H1-type domain-containing protein n=1 Tax=Pholiota conissans TaxID=109636 RepID=A0A9P5ZBJ8_9AGAR|nr:hypothetical protein BDN70DRAFT_872152 [Pholiota conissans]